MSADEDSDPADEAWLFEGGPAPDSSSARIERLLALHGHPASRRVRSSWRRSPRVWLAAAAVVLLGLALALLPGEGHRGAYVVRGPGGRKVVQAGERVETLASSANIEVASIGQLDLEPGSILRVLAREPGRHRFFLERGALVARISAQPRAFQVDTPAGSSVDLGCVYRLDVDGQGLTRLSVDVGRVAFEDASSGRNVYVPQGASCLARPGQGPCSPTFDDADPAWSAAVAELDFAATPQAELLRALEESSDTLGLWHLLGAASAAVRGAAFDRLAVLVPAPPGAAREAIVTSADARSGSPAHAARRAWLERMPGWYSFDW